jgi:hypothetical protein
VAHSELILIISNLPAFIFFPTRNLIYVLLPPSNKVPYILCKNKMLIILIYS